MTAPIDRLKTLLQVQGQQKVLGAKGNLTALEILARMRSQGWRTMWRGNGVNCLKIFPETAVRYAIFEWLNNTRPLSRLGPTRNYEFLLNGGLTGFLVQFGMFPFELVKTRVMTSPGRLTARLAIREIWAEEGTILKRIPKFYRGAGPALLGVVPFAALELGSCKIATDTYCTFYGTSSPGFWPLAGIGLCAQLVAMTATYPFRLITCQLQARRGVNPLTSLQTVQDVLRREGVSGLFRGYLANALNAGPATAISWAVFSTAKTKYDILQGYYNNTYS